MEREHCFEGYSKERYYDDKKYLKTENGEYERPTMYDKRCYSCREAAARYGNKIDFWCKH